MEKGFTHYQNKKQKNNTHIDAFIHSPGNGLSNPMEFIIETQNVLITASFIFLFFLFSPLFSRQNNTIILQKKKILFKLHIIAILIVVYIYIYIYIYVYEIRNNNLYTT